MFLKIIALLAAAIPAFLFLRALVGRRPSKFGNMMREAKKQFDLAIWIFLGIIGCVVVVGIGKLAWAWWAAS